MELRAARRIAKFVTLNATQNHDAASSRLAAESPPVSTMLYYIHTSPAIYQRVARKDQGGR